jgi:hypothetical protein
MGLKVYNLYYRLPSTVRVPAAPTSRVHPSENEIVQIHSCCIVNPFVSDSQRLT